MLSVNDNQVESLDQRYVEFTARTSLIFQTYPQLEPLRHIIFKELLVKREKARRTDQVKRWLRPLVRRGQTDLSREQTDVLIVLESQRDVIAEALLPVHRELSAQGVKVKVLSIGGSPEPSCSPILFRFRTPIATHDWARNAWQALCRVETTLRNDSLKRAFNIYAAGIQGMLDECDRVLAALSPRVVLLASTQLPGGASMIAAARARGIPSVLLQHGILQVFYAPITADHMLLWGESSVEILERLNVPVDKLAALGSPRHDRMVPVKAGKPRRTLLRELGLPDRPTFAFFSNGNDLVRNGKAPLECAKWLESAAAKYSNKLNIVVRLHPNEDGSLYGDCNNLRLTKSELDLTTVLDGCDWVGSLCSTVLYDALLYEKPVWQFYADGWPELADNWKCGLAERVSSEIDLRDRLEASLNDAGTGRFDRRTRDRVFANHGRAASAVADYVARQVTPNAIRREDSVTCMGCAG